MDVTHITSDRGYARLKGTVISSSQSKGFRSFPLHTDPLQITSSKQWPNFSLAERSTSEAMKRYLSFTRSMDVNTCVYQLFIWVIPMMDMWRLCGDQLSPKYRRMIFSVLNILNCSPCQKCLPGYLLHVLEQVRENWQRFRKQT